MSCHRRYDFDEDMYYGEDSAVYSEEDSEEDEPWMASKKRKTKAPAQPPRKRKPKDVPAGGPAPMTQEFDPRRPPASIDFATAKPAAVPAHWAERKGGLEAARGVMPVFRLVGSVALEIVVKKQGALQRLDGPVKPTSVIRSSDGIHQTWDGEGEPGNDCGLIPINRLYLGSCKGELECRQGPQLLEGMYALAIPDSPWKQPLARVIIPGAQQKEQRPAKKGQRSKRPKEGEGEVVVLTAFVYVSRLLFELIACPHIKHVLDHLTPPRPVHRPLLTRPTYPPCFKSHITKQHARDPRYPFSLAGLLKRAEHLGYREENDPTGLQLCLFPYQRQTLAWCLDQESQDLNSRFWEGRSWADGGGEFWYFPMAGELRLQQPPRVTGGIIAEEMVSVSRWAGWSLTAAPSHSRPCRSRAWARRWRCCRCCSRTVRRATLGLWARRRRRRASFGRMPVLWWRR